MVALHQRKNMVLNKNVGLPTFKYYIGVFIMIAKSVYKNISKLAFVMFLFLFGLYYISDLHNTSLNYIHENVADQYYNSVHASILLDGYDFTKGYDWGKGKLENTLADYVDKQINDYTEYEVVTDYFRLYRTFPFEYEVNNYEYLFYSSLFSLIVSIIFMFLSLRGVSDEKV